MAGLPCAYDTDLQCPFGRCINGRCGGCQSGADCKSGAACLSTPVGMACMPSGAPPSTPAPTATTPPTPAPTATTPPAPSDPFAAARARCLDRINAYRGSAGVAPLSSNAGKLACVDGQAQKDALAQTAHGAFGQCSEAAQNECPGWSGTPESVVDSCLDMMFKEGPGSGSAHGHYTNMMEPSYRTVACGFYVTSSGAVWITQDFYR
ncbi:MAG: CAP domain-containing protein [Myxococcales bacterium]|nr:CAP domain-containing protein [Myxococcales bacterium]MCB9576696.1 CAP domain-containing protein [Polyangiaceae bacterium]